MTQYSDLKVSDFLDSDEVIAEYLNAAFEDGDPQVFLMALGEVAKARGMTYIAAKSGLGRESLYKALRPTAHPRFETIFSILGALGVKLTVAPDQRPALSA